MDADVSKIADLQRLIDATVKAFGRLDIMVNNAGIETRTSVLDTTEEQYEAVLRVNLKSAFFGTQLAAKQMIKQGGGGHIINITSVHEDWPMPGNTAYCLSKGGMRMLTRTAGVELAPHKILVVGVGPGAVATPINRSTMANPAEMAKLDAAIPLGRMAQPEEIASVVACWPPTSELHHRDHGVRRWRPDAEQPGAVREESHAATLRRHHRRQRRGGESRGHVGHRLRTVPTSWLAVCTASTPAPPSASRAASATSRGSTRPVGSTRTLAVGAWDQAAAWSTAECSTAE